MKNPNFKATLLVRTYGTDTYGIVNTEGMTKEEILNACDPNNWGGEVYKDFCRVYTD